MSDYKTLTFEQRDNIAIITLHRPDAANGLDMQMSEELLDVSAYCSDEESIRAVLLTADGKMFCPGGDLKSFAQYGDKLPTQAKLLTTAMHGAISRFIRMPKPLITAVNGVAAGAGFSIAMTGDIVIAAESAKFTMAYTAAGLSPDGGASYVLPRIIGLRKTQELMINNRVLSSQEALDWGLVTQIVDDASLMDTALKTTQKLANGPTLAYSNVKQLLLNTFDNGLEKQMELEAQMISDAMKTDDGKAGIAAFLAKEKPSFNGK